MEQTSIYKRNVLKKDKKKNANASSSGPYILLLFDRVNGIIAIDT